MYSASEFIDELICNGYGPFLCVPCSNFKELTRYLLSKYPEQYMVVNNEGEALSIASGIALNNKSPVVMCQNSGLCNLLDPLTSLNMVYNIPILFIISWRGKFDLNDEEQHKIMGEITEPILDLLNIKYLYLNECFDNCKQWLNNNRNNISSILIDKNTFYAQKRENVIEKYKNKLSKRDAIKTIVENIDSKTKLFSTNGYISRILYNVCHRKEYFYMFGSMGCISSIALGYALYNKDDKVIVIDGDGAFLMRLESIATIANYSPNKFVHIVLDDGKYESTGAQPTLTYNLNIENIASAIGYKRVYTVSDINELDEVLKIDAGEILFIRVIIDSPSAIEERPQIKPCQIKEFFAKNNKEQSNDY